MNPRVPYCNDCSSHKHYKGYLHGKGRHWCLKAKTSFGGERFITVKEARTSPQWCPKRKESKDNDKAKAKD